MDDMTSHRRNWRHGGTAPRNYPWPLLLIAAPAAVAIWSGWVGLGSMCGFGPVNLLPGVGGGFHLDTAITLPVGVESYGTYALFAWLAMKGLSDRTRDFARKSAIGALVLGCLGQIAYHLMAAAGWTRAPWFVVMLVSCLPVMTVYFAATLTHLILADRREAAPAAEVMSEVTTEAVPDVTTEVTVEDDPVVATEEPDVVTAEDTSVVNPDVTPEVTTKRRRIVPAKATDDELIVIILDATDDPAALTNYKVTKAIKAACGGKGVGEARAARLVDLAQRKHRSRSVVAIGDRR